MSIKATRQEYFESFRAGEKTAYAILVKSADLESLKRSDFLLRKVGENELAIIIWREKAKAEEFLRSTVRSQDFEVIEITGAHFRSFLENTFDEESRSNINCEMI